MIFSIINLTLVCLGLIYIFKRKRKLDFLCIYFFSSIIYYFPILINRLSYPYRVGRYMIVNDIYWEASLVVFLNLEINITIMFITDKKEIKKSKKVFVKKFNQDLLDISVLILSSLSMILILWSFFSLKTFLFDIDNSKMELLTISTWRETWIGYIASVIPVYALLTKGRFRIPIRVLSILMLAYTLVLQKRSVLVFVLITILYLVINKLKKDQPLYQWLLKNKMFIVLIIFFGLTVIIMKPLLPALFSLNIDEIKTIIFNIPSSLSNYLLLGESNIISLNLNEVLRHGITNNPLNIFYSIISILPLSGTIFGFNSTDISFNSFADIIYAHMPDNIGFGSTFLGEMICSLSIFFGLIAIFIFLYFCNKFFSNIEDLENILLKTVGYAVFPILSFYIHRNSISFVIGYFKYIIYITILILLIYTILNIIKNFLGGNIYEKL